MKKLNFKNLSIKQIFLIGLLIRLLVMPFFAHEDLYSVHKRAETIVCGPETVFSYPALGVHTLESFFMIITLPITPCSQLANLHASPPQIDHIFKMIFFFKLPYLAFEIGFWYLIWFFVKNCDQKMKKRAAIFLSFNPVSIYSVYLFGRFESYPLFFTALILNLLARKNYWPTKKLIFVSSLLMSLNLTLRLSYVLIVPTLAVSFGSLNLAFLSTFFTLAFYYFIKAVPAILGLTPKVLVEEAWIKTGAHPNYLFEGAISAGGQRKIYLFFLLVTICFIWWLENKNTLTKTGKEIIFSKFASAVFLSYYATSLFHPQYLSWIIPFYFILMIKDKKGFLWKSFWLSLPFYFIFILKWGNAVTFGLLSPITLSFRQIDPEVFLPLLDIVKWVNIGKTVFAAFCLYWIYYVFKK